MKQHSKLSQSQQQTEQHGATHETHQQAGKEFASSEELIRFDASHIKVPPEIALRLKHSLAQEAAPRRSWWKNLLGQ